MHSCIVLYTSLCHFCHLFHKLHKQNKKKIQSRKKIHMTHCISPWCTTTRTEWAVGHQRTHPRILLPSRLRCLVVSFLLFVIPFQFRTGGHSFSIHFLLGWIRTLTALHPIFFLPLGSSELDPGTKKDTLGGRGNTKERTKQTIQQQKEHAFILRW